MGKLPKMRYGSGTGEVQQVSFGGLKHSVNCADGEIFDMRNISVKEHPIMSVRAQRGKTKVVSETSARIYADNGVMLRVTEFGLYYEHIQVLEAAEMKDPNNTFFVRFGNRVLMMPDKVLLNLTYEIKGIASELPTGPEKGDCYIHKESVIKGKRLKLWDGEQWQDGGLFAEPIEAHRDLGAVTVGDGTLYGESAKANTITLEYTRVEILEMIRIRVGDGITISGMTVAENNKTAIVREIGVNAQGKAVLRFSDYCFTIPETEDGEEQTSYREEAVTIYRTMPDMEFMFEHGNRLWGAKGKEIFASKLGDPMNWNCFEGLGDSSWYLATQSKGDITGGISYRYPVFFREGSMLTVYGTSPAAFQTSETDVAGVRRGCHRSLGRCNGYLVWLAGKGVMLYDGNSVYPQESVFGEWNIKDMLTLGDGDDFFCVADPEDTESEVHGIFRYDTGKGLWTREDCGKIFALTEDEGKMYCLCDTNGRSIQIINGTDPEQEEGTVESFAEFGDITVGTMNSKHLSKLRLRVELEKEAGLSLWIQYDSTGQWQKLYEILPGKKRSLFVPVIPRRCDHFRLRLQGRGKWRLFALEKEIYQGGTKK